MWDEVVGLLAGKARALQTPSGLSFEETATALAGIGGAGAYVGYSQGGRLAFQIALDRPADVTQLVVISASAGLAAPQAAERRREDESLARVVESHGVAAFLAHWLQQPIFAGRDTAAAAAHRLRQPHEIAAQLRSLGQGSMPNLWPRLSKIRIPVLVVAGELDRKYSAIAGELARAIGDNAELRLVPGAGHALVETHPEAVAALLGDFLDL
jgi:2-succinyl-6-hydroxy-2,4-cyclohexadiene-1-carboxylate synthase